MNVIFHGSRGEISFTTVSRDPTPERSTKASNRVVLAVERRVSQDFRDELESKGSSLPGNREILRSSVRKPRVHGNPIGVCSSVSWFRILPLFRQSSRTHAYLRGKRVTPFSSNSVETFSFRWVGGKLRRS